MPDPSSDDLPEIGTVGLGTSRLYQLEVDDAVRLIDGAADAGMNFVDCSDVWGFDPAGAADPGERPGFGAAEERLGQVLAASPSLRDELFIATKGGAFPPIPLDSSAEYLRQACDSSLYRLGIERIDLYQVHQPDFLTHPAEVAEVLTDLVEAGKVRQVGVCQYNPSQVSVLQSMMDVPLATVSMPFNLLSLGPLIDGRLDQAMERGMLPLGTQPLSGGRLLGDLNGKTADAVAVCQRISVEQSVPLAAVLVAFLAHHPASVVPIVSTTSLDHLKDVALADEVGLSRQQWYEIYSAAKGGDTLRGLP